MDAYIIESAMNFIHILTKPITYYCINYKDTTLYKSWSKYNIELFNSQNEFISMGQTNNIDNNIFNKSYHDNYNSFKSKVNLSKRSQISPENPEKCYYKLEKKIQECYDLYNYKSIDNLSPHQILKLHEVNTNIRTCIKYEEKNYEDNKEIIQLLILFVYQYLNEFENKSININMWNYSLRTLDFSKKYFYLGVITIFSQVSWLTILIYNIVTEYEPNFNRLILIVTTLSSLISALYSFDTIHSFYNSFFFYKFTYNLYNDFKCLNGNYNLLAWNFTADFISNCLIPFTMPFINFFVVLHSDSVLEAILNSMAIFFVINIDEELYTRTDYEDDSDMKKFVKKILSVIYKKISPVHAPDFTYTYDIQSNHIYRLAFDLDKKINNSKYIN